MQINLSRIYYAFFRKDVIQYQLNGRMTNEWIALNHGRVVFKKGEFFYARGPNGNVFSTLVSKTISGYSFMDNLSPEFAPHRGKFVELI